MGRVAELGSLAGGFPIPNEQLLQTLSLTARLAIALHCFRDYCRKLGLQHVEIERLLDDLWEFPVDNVRERWDEWEHGHPVLLYVGLGDAWPEGFEEFLRSNNVDPDDFRPLITGVVEVVFSSFYAAADDKESMEHLRNVLTIVTAVGVEPRPLERFASSRFADGHGWGKPLTITERDEWRGTEGADAHSG